MRIVVDANIFIAALMGSRGKLVIITSQNYDFYAPANIVREIMKYREKISERMNWTSQEFDISFNALIVFIKPIKEKEYELFMEKVVSVMNKRDVKDSDYVACALYVGADFIWSDDNDFTEQNLIQVKNTAEFIEGNK